MQTRQNVEKMAKCGDFFSGARSNAKLFLPNGKGNEEANYDNQE